MCLREAQQRDTVRVRIFLFIIRKAHGQACTDYFLRVITNDVVWFPPPPLRLLFTSFPKRSENVMAGREPGYK